MKACRERKKEAEEKEAEGKTRVRLKKTQTVIFMTQTGEGCQRVGYASELVRIICNQGRLLTKPTLTKAQLHQLDLDVWSSYASAAIAERRSFDNIPSLLKSTTDVIDGIPSYGGVVQYRATENQVLKESNDTIIQLLATNDVVIVTVSVST